MRSAQVHPTQGEEDLANQHGNDESSRRAFTVHPMLAKYAAETTLHGIRNMFESESFPLRRILWTVVVLLCGGFCANQFYNRITNFMGNPTAVDFDIIYTDLLPFPRITFCNYNLIKLTTVSSEQASIVLTFFRLSSSPDSDLIHQLEAIDKNGTMNLTEAFRQGHHQIEDALITCDFRGIRCGISNFTLIVTDYGWCYQFVGDGGTLYVTDAGMRHGLSLTLNAEQYEYVGGPRLGVGYLMSIHSPEDTPLIEEKGIAVPVGGETLINLDMTEVSLIPPPNGDCSNKHMKSDNKYSVSTCHRECMSDYIVATCGCEDFVTGSRLQQAVASLSQNATEINLLFNGVISRIMSPLSQLVQVGLPDINRYMTESNVRTFSIDEDFIRDNVVNVNIFLGEMSRQTKNKKMTDSYTSLICDLGGTFGLFLGASLMTLYEFVDIVVYALGHRCSTRAKGASSADNGSS